MNVAPITQINNDYGAVISHINISSYYTSETKKEIYQ
jgi:hypothetical protein